MKKITMYELLGIIYNNEHLPKKIVFEDIVYNLDISGDKGLKNTYRSNSNNTIECNTSNILSKLHSEVIILDD